MRGDTNFTWLSSVQRFADLEIRRTLRYVQAARRLPMKLTFAPGDYV